MCAGFAAMNNPEIFAIFAALHHWTVTRMLSRRAKYAIRTLLYLHDHGGRAAVSAKMIAANEKIPYKFLENILRELRQHRILKSERGADGGYKLLKTPESIKVSDIIRIVDGP